MNLNPRARMCSEGLLYMVGRFVGQCLCSHVFSRTVAAVDTKRGYVGMCNGRSALERRCPRTVCLRRGPKIIYSYYTRCALIRDRRPTAWDGFARPAETEAKCIYLESKPSDSSREISKSLYYNMSVE